MRKNILGLNISDEEGGRIDGARFIIREVDSSITDEQMRLSEEYQAHKKTAELPFILRIARLVLLWVGVLTIFEFVASCADVEGGFATALSNAGGLLAIGVVSLALGIALQVVSVKKAKAVASSDAFQGASQRGEELHRMSMESLAVPADAKRVDLFFHIYREKNGKIRDALPMARYVNSENHLFVEGDTLCLADDAGVIGIPISSVREVVAIDKSVTVAEWNKKEAYNQGEYKEYKINRNRYGAYSIKPYYSLRITYAGEEYELLVPGYDIKPFCDILGMQPHPEEV